MTNTNWTQFFSKGGANGESGNSSFSSYTSSLAALLTVLIPLSGILWRYYGINIYVGILLALTVIVACCSSSSAVKSFI